MAGMYGASEAAGPGKGKNRPNSKAKVAARRTARKESGMSAQKFYVKTRMAEAAKSGKTVDRAALRKKFQSGDVARKGFGAPKKSSGSSSSSSKKTDMSPTTDSSSRSGYKSPTSTKRTPQRGADTYGSPKKTPQKGTNRLVNTIRSVYSANPRNIPVTSRLTQKRK